MASTKRKVVRAKTTNKNEDNKRENKTNEDKVKNDSKKYHCVKCGATYSSQQGNFLKNTSAQLFEYNNNYIPICTDCLNAFFEDCIVKYENAELATQICCAVGFFYFDKDIYKESVQRKSKYTFSDYVKTLNQKYFNSYINNRSCINNIVDNFNSNFLNEEKDNKWTAEELRSKEQVIELMGYDPFRDYRESDQQYLFSELIKYLDDDELLSDNYKLSQVLQLVNNNNQIRQCDTAISMLDPLYNIEDIKTLASLKAGLVTSNDKIAKENRISVKNREGSSGGKGTITGLMREMREKNIDEIALNYYDQLRSPSSRWAAEISAKALKENCYFDENDLNEMLYDQREMIQKLQMANDELTEKNRKLEYKAFMQTKDGES